MEYLAFGAELAGVAVIVLVLSLVVHEVGHLLGGWSSGYELIYIEFFGLVFWGKGSCIKDEKIRYVPGLPAGQCVMAPKKENDGPVRLVCSGCTATVILALLSAFVFIALQTDIAEGIGVLWRFGVLLTSFVNGALYIINWYGKDATNDGNTARLLVSDEGQASIYNRICVLAAALCAGMTYSDVAKQGQGNGSFFDTMGLSGSLAEEMQLYEFYSLMETEPEGERVKELVEIFKARMEVGSPFEKDIRCELVTYALAFLDIDENNLMNIVKISLCNSGAEPAREAVKVMIAMSVYPALDKLLTEVDGRRLCENMPQIQKKLSRMLGKLAKGVLFEGQYKSASVTVERLYDVWERKKKEARQKKG